MPPAPVSVAQMQPFASRRYENLDGERNFDLDILVSQTQQ